jgi:homoserine O-acetyltransferase
MVEAVLAPVDRVREADEPHSHVVRFGSDKPLRLDAGVDLAPFQIAYQTYGTLNADRTNAILTCHALTGDQHVANVHPVTGKGGWWDTMVGPGRPIDTERYFVICPNVIGACMGSSGPASTNAQTGAPWGLDFPVITIRDMVRAQAMLLDHLGIESLFSVAGGSMGGMQVLQWTASYPERVFSALHRKFGRRFQDRDNPTFSFDADFQVESYLRHQGISFVERFDANSYLYLTRAMDYFDLAGDYDGVLANAWKKTQTRFCVISFTSDWLFPTSESRAIVHALNAGGARVSFAEIVTDKGHDAFLLDEPELFAIVRGFLEGAARARGLPAQRR